MYLNTIQPAVGSKKKSKRLGRGIGSGKGKTCGKGHKGQKARAGGYHKVGFEGGQMPLQRRIPKSGFCSRGSLSHQELYLSDLNTVDADIIDITVLRNTGLIKANTKTIKIIASGELTRTITLRGVPLTSGARKVIESLNGKVELG